MTDDISPIIDFYPSSFEIDMNGKKMVWQGVALLPFIDEKRLLDAMAPYYPNLTEEEHNRNRWGSNVIYASDEHPVYPFYEKLYGKRKNREVCPLWLPFLHSLDLIHISQPEVIDVRLSKGISGSVLPNPDCIPGSTYYSPLPQPELPDIKNDRSLSVLYYFPKQLKPHRSELLPGARKPPRQLSAADLEVARNGGRGRGRGPPDAANGGGRNSWNNGGYAERRSDPFQARPNNYGSQSSAPRGRGTGYGGRGGNPHLPPSYPQRPSYPQGSQGGSHQQYGPSGYGAPGGRPPPPHHGNYRGSPPRGRPNGATYGGYNASAGGYDGNAGGYGTYGGGHNNGAYGNYGNYGGHHPPPYPPRGTPSHPSRGRGRGWQLVNALSVTI